MTWLPVLSWYTVFIWTDILAFSQIYRFISQACFFTGCKKKERKRVSRLYTLTESTWRTPVLVEIIKSICCVSQRKPTLKKTKQNLLLNQFTNHWLFALLYVFFSLLVILIYLWNKCNLSSWWISDKVSRTRCHWPVIIRLIRLDGRNYSDQIRSQYHITFTQTQSLYTSNIVMMPSDRWQTVI